MGCTFEAGEGRMKLQGVRVLFSFCFTPSTSSMELVLDRSLTPSTPERNSLATPTGETVESGTIFDASNWRRPLSAYRSTGTIWASIFSPFLVQDEAQSKPMHAHQRQL